MFRTSDLVISALPKEALEELRACLWGTRICIRPTIHCVVTHLTCIRWTYITCWQGSCGFATCFGFTCPGGTCPGRTIACHVGTLPDPTGCPGGSIYQEITTTVVNPATIVINEVADIKTLRVQMNEVLEKLGDLEQRGLDAGLHTAEELDEVEARLKTALSEVQAQKKGATRSKK